MEKSRDGEHSMPSMAARLEAGHDMLMQVEMSRLHAESKGCLNEGNTDSLQCTRATPAAAMLAHIRSGVSIACEVPLASFEGRWKCGHSICQQ